MAEPSERRGPFLLVAETFRMGGHATHDEREARQTFDKDLFEYWGKRDPIGQFENYLLEGTLDLESGHRMRRTPALRARNAEVLIRAEERVTAEVERAIEEALASRALKPVPESAAEGVYANTESAAIIETSTASQ
jgi:TPP-dependent pyruvate/acetoin dehydrogenase alpha subunit